MMLILSVLAALAADPEPKTDAEIVKLQQERVEALREMVKWLRADVDRGTGSLRPVVEVSAQLLQAELDLATKPAERIAAHLEYLKLIVLLHAHTAAAVEAGASPRLELVKVADARLKAEIELRRAGGKPPKELAWPAMPKR